jgi:hypothetical protein
MQKAKEKRDVRQKSREDEGERKRRRRDVGELAGCPRKFAVVGGEWPSSASPTIQLLI